MPAVRSSAAMANSLYSSGSLTTKRQRSVGRLERLELAKVEGEFQIDKQLDTTAVISGNWLIMVSRLGAAQEGVEPFVQLREFPTGGFVAKLPHVGLLQHNTFISRWPTAGHG